MYGEKHFDEVLARTNLAFSKSSTKGLVFWYNAALPDSEENNKANEAGWNSLRETFTADKPDQLALAEKVIQDLQYIRAHVLKYEWARKKLEDLKSFLVEMTALEDIADSLEEHVATHYDKIKSALESKKAS
jgi:hypothetical protein